MSVDPQQFRQLALAELDAVHRLAVHLCRDAEAAADLVQETFARAFAAAPTFRLGERGIRPWLFKILHNVFYNRLGRQQREPTLLDDLQAEAVAHELDAEPPAWDLSSLDWEYVDDRLKRAVDELPTTYRAILLLWAVEGLKYREIADVLDIPLGTVMSRLYRARMTLSAALADLAKEKGIEL